MCEVSTDLCKTHGQKQAGDRILSVDQERVWENCLQLCLDCIKTKPGSAGIGASYLLSVIPVLISLKQEGLEFRARPWAMQGDCLKKEKEGKRKTQYKSWLKNINTWT